MSIGQPFRVRYLSSQMNVVMEIDGSLRIAALLYFIAAVFADPSRVDKLVAVMAQPDELNEKGLLQDDEIALFVTRVVAAVKDCKGDMNMAREKELEFRMQL